MIIAINYRSSFGNRLKRFNFCTYLTYSFIFISTLILSYFVSFVLGSVISITLWHWHSYNFWQAQTKNYRQYPTLDANPLLDNFFNNFLQNHYFGHRSNVHPPACHLFGRRCPCAKHIRPWTTFTFTWMWLWLPMQCYMNIEWLPFNKLVEIYLCIIPSNLGKLCYCRHTLRNRCHPKKLSSSAVCHNYAYLGLAVIVPT